MHERPDCGDALPDIALETPEGAALPKADIVLTNPPFGTKRGGGGAQPMTGN